MSFQASEWAANVPHGLVGYVAFRALALLANDAKEDGRATWLEASTIASRLEVSKRTVERAMDELRRHRLIEYGDQRYVQHLPANKRPPVYDLTMLSADALKRHKEMLSTGPAHTPPVGPSKLSAPTQGDGPKLSTGPTAVVGSYKEEPPLLPTKSSRGDHSNAHARDGLGPCPGRRDAGPHTFRGRWQWCDHCNRDRDYYTLRATQ
jgi:hypothetical protein